MKVRLTDNEIRLRVTDSEMQMLAGGSTVSCAVTRDATIHLGVGDGPHFALLGSIWTVTISAADVQRRAEVVGPDGVGSSIVDYPARDGSPRVLVEIDRQRRARKGRSSPNRQSGRFSRSKTGDPSD